MPWVIVIGRSVLGRTVRHGTPSTVVSSWIPPESVTTSADAADERQEVEVAERLDDAEARRLDQAGLGQGRAAARVERQDDAAARRRRSRSIATSAVAASHGSSTLAGRWSVTTA